MHKLPRPSNNHQVIQTAKLYPKSTILHQDQYESYLQHHTHIQDTVLQLNSTTKFSS
ncbi:MAG TPA: hypothetical protein VKR58_13065 [Aquella sp.]|nr:hypothetical protein [Aquella sp.]